MRYAITLIFCLFTLYSSAQNLELKQLQSFLEKPVEAVSDSLNHKGWIPHQELSGTQGDQLYKTFSYGNKAADKVKALAWFRIHADKGIINQLYYQSPGKPQYDLLLAEIKQTGAVKKEAQGIENKQISTYYVSKDYIFQTIVSADSYTIMAMQNKNY